MEVPPPVVGIGRAPAARHRLSRRQVLGLAGLGVAAAGLGLGLRQALVPPLAPRKVPRLGLLSPAITPAIPVFDALRQGLRELGYVDGETIILEYRLAAGQSERLPALAAELVRLPVDVMFANGTEAALAAKQATSTIPIVMTSDDPVGTGLVTSLARPDGNLTGVSLMTVQLSGKRLQLLTETVPAARHVAVLHNPQSTSSNLQWRETQSAAQALGVQLQRLEAGNPAELERVLATLAHSSADAFLGLSDAALSQYQAQIAASVTQARLPSMFPSREYVAAGGLMAYGPDRGNVFRRAATYVDKILKGTKPADIPVEQPTTFEFVLNLKTAQALGLTFPQSILLQATEVIQ